MEDQAQAFRENILKYEAFTQKCKGVPEIKRQFDTKGYHNALHANQKREWTNLNLTLGTRTECSDNCSQSTTPDLVEVTQEDTGIHVGCFGHQLEETHIVVTGECQGDGDSKFNFSCRPQALCQLLNLPACNVWLLSIHNASQKHWTINIFLREITACILHFHTYILSLK